MTVTPAPSDLADLYPPHTHLWGPADHAGDRKCLVRLCTATTNYAPRTPR